MVNSIGPIIFDLNGLEITQEEKEILQHPLIGGVIFFARNYQSPQQISNLARSIREIKQSPVLICVDQEGGRVQRFREGFTRIPAMGHLGRLYHASPEKGIELAKACGYIIAAELLQVGVDLSFTPVIDLHKMDNPAINDRAFDADPMIVCQLAEALMAGMAEAGMAHCGKHFPGHGAVKVDSHVALPEDYRTLDEILQDDLIPFSKLSLKSMMASHILFPQVDQTPAGFSKVWLQDILRKKLNYTGVVFSDDLSMKGAVGVGDCPTRSLQALEAGCDMILLCNSREDVVKTLATLPSNLKRVPFDKFSQLLGKPTVDALQLQQKQKLLSSYNKEFNLIQ